jgi:molybdopterin/thiamine biosynthesis adenylyltransferase
MSGAQATSSVLILGAGGLGCPAALALGAAGVTRIGIVDDDRVDVSNLHRQVLFGDADVGELKVIAFARALAHRYPALRVEPHPVRFEVTNAEALVDAYDIIVDGTDNFAAKFLANDAAVLAGKPLVHGAAVALGGQLLTVPGAWTEPGFAWRSPSREGAGTLPGFPHRIGGRPCYRCLFEEPPAPGIGPSCAEAGVLGPVPGVIGALLGAEAARLAKGETPAFVGRLVQYDSRSMSVRAVRFNPNPQCAVCAPGARIHALAAADYPAAECSPQ